MEDLLNRLASQGIRLWLDGESLRLSGPAHALDAGLREELRSRKPELVDFLHRSSAPAASATLERRPPGEPVPVTLAQQRLLRLSHVRKADSDYNVPLAFELRGEFNGAALNNAVRLIEQRHEVLRTTFPDFTTAIVSPTAHAIVIDVHGTTHMDDRTDMAEALSILRREVCRPFDLANGPLWRPLVVKISRHHRLLAFVFHHLIFDGFSRNVFLSDFASIYNSLRDGRSPDLEPVELHHADYAVWMRQVEREAEDRIGRDRTWWQTEFSEPAPSLQLPCQRTVTTPSQGDGQAFEFTGNAHRKLEEWTAAWGVSPGAILTAAAIVTLNQHSGQTDLTFCTPLTNRNDPRLEAAVGYFNSVVPVRVRLDESRSLRDIAVAVHRKILGAADHPLLGLDEIASLPGMSRCPLNRCLISYQQVSDTPFALTGLDVRPLSVRKDACDFDLAFQFETSATRTGVTIDFDVAKFSAVSIGQLFDRIQTTLDHILADPNGRVDDLPSFRISREELTSQLAGHSQIDQAAVKLDGPTGIVTAWLVLNEFDVPTLEDIRRWLDESLESWQSPQYLVPIGQLPLTTTGKVDVDSLQPPLDGRDRLASSYTPPQTELEQTIADIWKEVLWLEHDVGRDDSFRDLGGHSLLSVRIVLELEQRLGKTLPTEALGQLGTVAELAQSIEEAADPRRAPTAPTSCGLLAPDVEHGLRSYVSSWDGWRKNPDSLVVGKNISGTRVPLFWCLQNYHELTQLAKYMGEDQIVFGMRSGNRVMVKDQANIRQLAAHYVAEIESILPQGPLLVGGNCQAALIAFQVAQLFVERGREIPLLFLHEKFVPASYAGNVALTFGQHSDWNPYRTNGQPEQEFSQYYRGRFTIDLVAGGHGDYFNEPNVQDFTRVLKMRRDEFVSAISPSKGGVQPGPPFGPPLAPRRRATAAIRTLARKLGATFERATIPSLASRAAENPAEERDFDGRIRDDLPTR